MTEVAETANSTPERLEVAAVIPASPGMVWSAFTDAELLCAWWPEQATTDPVVGGEIIARWPSMEWTMRGRYTELDPHRVVAFTWSWGHEPDTPERLVRITLVPAGGSTLLTLSHGDYGPEHEDERTDHFEGWRHFLPGLRGLGANQPE